MMIHVPVDEHTPLLCGQPPERGVLRTQCFAAALDDAVQLLAEVSNLLGPLARFTPDQLGRSRDTPGNRQNVEDQLFQR